MRSINDKMLTMNSLAPIALFVYKRLWHTRQTVDALRKNDLAVESCLFIFSDGPRKDFDRAAVAEVREYIKTVSGFKKVIIIERENNQGLAQSIISGVTQLTDEYGRVIVLEDDLVTSPFFLRYMNDALELYRNVDRVLHVSGSTYPVGDFCSDDSYLLRVPLCWGWGTWKRAWNLFEKNIEIMNNFDKRMIARFDFDGTHPFWLQLELNRSGRIDTWFVFWYARVFLSDALALFPRQSLVKNIGYDGTGVHCGKSKDYDVELSAVPIRVLPVPLKESQEAVNRHKQYFRSIRPKLPMRAMRALVRIAKGWMPG